MSRDCKGQTIRHFGPSVTNTYEDNLKGGRISFAHVSAFPGHGWLVLLLWACVEAEHHGRSAWWNKGAHLMEARKQNETTRDQGQSISSQGTVPVI
jgi:hypothetical protein